MTARAFAITSKIGGRMRIDARLALLGAVSPFVALPAFAQQAAPAENARIDDIVVTALHRATNVQETPLAISAIGGEALTNQGISTSDGLAKVAPNLVIRENANGGSRIIIRNIQSSGEPTVGLYYDETPITGSTGVGNDAGGTTPAVRLFDVERVEVLRGPQGTLYGASSMAGTVRLIFKKPNLTQFEGEVSGQLAGIAHGDLGYNAQVALNAPIVHDKLGVRAVGFYERIGGWLDNSVLGLTNFNDSKSYGGRLLARYQPNDDVTFDALAVYQKREGYSGLWDYKKYIDTGVRYDQTLDTVTPQTDEMQLYSGTLNWDFSFATLTAIAAYSKRDLAFSFNYSPYFRRASVTAPGAAGCLRYFGLPVGVGAKCSTAQVAEYKQDYIDPFLPAPTYQPQSTKTWSQEVRLAGGERLKWTLGFFHSKRRNFVRSVIAQATPRGEIIFPITPFFDRTVDDTLEQFAGFGEFTYEVIDGLNVTAGLRYFDYKKKTTSEVLVGNLVVGNEPSPASTNRASEDGTILNFNVNYKITPDVMIYASATQGFRPGGVNQVVGISDDQAAYAGAYQSDSIWNYELGVKSSLLDYRLTLNANLFQIDWNNMQVRATANNGSFAFVTNAGRTRIRGVELEAIGRPIDGLTLRASGSYTSARLRGNQIAVPGVTISGAGLDGDYVPLTPKYTAQGSAEYVFPVSDTLEILTLADIGHIGSSWTEFRRDPTRDYQLRIPAMTVTGLRAGVQSSDGNWGIYAFVTNLFDVTGVVNNSRGASIGGDDPRGLSVNAIAPRTIGLNFRKNF